MEQKRIKKNVAVYPGSFDPITFGHLDIIKRACKIFGKLIILVAYNPNKSTMFDVHERLSMVKNVTKNIKNVEVKVLKNLLVDFLKNTEANIIIRGLRAVSDFEYEFQMALTNRKLQKTIETVFLMPDEKYTYLSSSIVKEIASLSGNVKEFVPESVSKLLKAKVSGN